MDNTIKVSATALTGWGEVVNLARNTVWKEPLVGDVEPSDRFKETMLESEHSPIRALMFRVSMIGIPYWVSVHLVRHKFGVEHFVSTQRTDRTGADRDGKRQDAPVNHIMIINAQELLFISRRRLCRMASPETQDVWWAVKEAIAEVDPWVARYMVPMCIYRGCQCHEAHGCGMKPRMSTPQMTMSHTYTRLMRAR